MWDLSVNIRDNKGAKSTVQAHLLGTATAAQATVVANLFAAAVLGLTTGRIIGVHIDHAEGLPAGNPAAPGLNSDVEEKGAFSFRTVDPGAYVYRVSIPALNEDFVLPGQDNIDLASPEVNEFIQLFVADIDVAGTPVRLRDARGEIISYVQSAKEVWGKKHRLPLT